MKHGRFVKSLAKFYTCALLSIWCGALQAQDFALKIDYARFNYDAQSAFFELYYSFDVSRQSGTAKMREVIVEERILRNDSVWVADAWRMQANVDSTGAEAHRIVDVLRHVAGPGRYQVEMTLRDVAGNASQQAQLNFQIEPAPKAALWMSDIQLAAMINKQEPDSTRKKFYKNQMLVISQVDRMYSDKRPMLFYYLELYNLLENVPGDIYQVRTAVMDAAGNVSNEVRSRIMRKSKTMNKSVEVGSLHLGKLPAGEYVLNFEVLAADNSVLGKKTKPFSMAASPVVVAGGMSPEFTAKFTALSEAQCKTAYKQAAYIMHSEERHTFEAMKDLGARQRFLAEFWARRDPSPGTPLNEFYEAYLRRIQYANENYRSFSREGWQTDRGRVYIVYGQPSDTEYFPSTGDSVPFELWRYDEIDGGVDFVFVDRSGFKEFRLVHSTKIGEINDPDWQTRASN